MSSLLAIYLCSTHVFIRAREAYLAVIKFAGPTPEGYEKSLASSGIRRNRRYVYIDQNMKTYVENYISQAWNSLLISPDKEFERLAKEYLIDANVLGKLADMLKKDVRLYMKLLYAHHDIVEEYNYLWWEVYVKVPRDTIAEILATDDLSLLVNLIRRYTASETCAVADPAIGESPPTLAPTIDRHDTSPPPKLNRIPIAKRRLTLEELCLACPTEAVVDKLQKYLGLGVKVTGESIPVSRQEVNSPKVSVIGANGSYFTDDEMLKVRDWIFTEKYADESVVGMASAKDRKYRIEADQPSLFTLGNGKVVMESADMTETGRFVLDKSCAMLSLVDEMVEEYIERNNLTDEVEFKPFKPNLIQIVVSDKANYSRHNDVGPETSITSHSGMKENPLSEFIPYDYEQRVLTMVFCFPVDEDAPISADDGSQEGHCILEHFRGGKTSTDKVSSVITEACSIHIQLWGLQKFFTHEVKLRSPSSSITKYKRVILSFRTSVPRNGNEDILAAAIRNSQSGKDFYVHKAKDIYVHQNVLLLQQPQNSTGTAITGDTPNRSRRVKKSRVPKSEFDIDKLLKNFGVHESTTYCERPEGRIDVGGSREAYECLRGALPVKMLLEHKHYLCNYYKPKIPPQEWLSQRWEMGFQQKATTTRNMCNISGSSFQVAVFNHNLILPDVFVLEQAYKNKLLTDNDGYGFNEVIKNVIDDKTRTWLYKQSPDSVKLWIGPSGGNGGGAGRHCQPNVTDKNRDKTHHTPAPQSISETSLSLDELVRSEAVIHLWAPVKWGGGNLNEIMSDQSSGREDDVIYLGLWYFCESIMKKRKELMWECNPLTRWAGEMSTVYYIKPLYNSESPPPDHIHDTSCELRPFPVSESITKICQYIPNRDAEINDKHVSLVGSEDLIEAWLKQVLLERCQTTYEEEDEEEYYRLCQEEVDAKLMVNETQYVIQAGRIAISSFAKMANKNVFPTKDDKHELRYLCSPEWLNLGWVLGTNTIPHPIRTYNLQTMTFIQALLHPNQSENENTCYNRADVKDSKQLTKVLFQSCVLRLAGVVGWYVDFANYAKKNHPEKKPKKLSDEYVSDIFIPGPDDLDIYRQYMESRSSLGENQPMMPFNKTLYRHSLLGSCTGTVGTFLDFLDSLSEYLTEKVPALYDSQTTSREDWVNLIERAFRDCNNRRKEATEKPLFLASMVISDVEEVLTDPFGEPQEIYLGSGGKRGLSMLSTSGKVSDLERAHILVKHLHTTASVETLETLGLYRKDNICYVTLNNRRIRITDVDNISCKVSVNQSKTTGARLIINNPGLYLLYEFPLPKQWECGFQMEIMVPIWTKALCHLSTADIFTKGKIHDQFKFNKEDEIWPRFCNKMEEWIENGGPPRTTSKKLTRKTYVKDRKRKRGSSITSNKSSEKAVTVRNITIKKKKMCKRKQPTRKNPKRRCKKNAQYSELTETDL